MGIPRHEYALYKGETFIGVGPLKEIAKRHGIPESTLRTYGVRRYKERNQMVLIKLEGEE